MPGSFVMLSISDTGTGIDADIWGRIFDPYFTTKEATGGTGIGLYMSRMIIEKALGGSIDPIAVAEGATFRIKLPLEKSA